MADSNIATTDDGGSKETALNNANDQFSEEEETPSDAELTDSVDGSGNERNVEENVTLPLDEGNQNNAEFSQQNVSGEQGARRGENANQPQAINPPRLNNARARVPGTITPADILDAGLHRNRRGIFMRYLFVTLTIRYAEFFKPFARRLIEFFSLLIALLMFLVLLYIHVTFIRSSGDCLNHVKDVWPPNGILRVQVTRNESTPAYQLLFAKNTLPSSFSVQSTPYDVHFKFSAPLFPADIQNYALWKEAILNETDETLITDKNNSMCPNPKVLNKYLAFHLNKKKCPILKQNYINSLKQTVSDTLASVILDMYVQYRSIDAPQETLLSLLTEIVEYDLTDTLPVREHYAIEYSVEFGYLRLSANARFRLGIPTLIVNLNPDMDACFGAGLKKFMLQTFLGYDDFLMSSIKKLAEGDKSQGYLRNMVTGEYFRFVSVWANPASGILAFLVMVLFSLIVSMLLRYSYHQIFMFMMEVLRILDADVRVAFPAAPMLTIVLALVGMEEIMTEFFHDSTVAFYVILLVWSADQFDTICLHTTTSRRHWGRFFYLYHFAFYMYNYKFNGQYSKLALFTSWLFIFHSMVYFFHHYEIPAIQRQMVISQRMQRILRNSNGDPPNQPENEQPMQQRDGDRVVNPSRDEEGQTDNAQRNNLSSNTEEPRQTNTVTDPPINIRYYIRIFFARVFTDIWVFLLLLSTMMSVALYNYILWSGPNFKILRWSI